MVGISRAACCADGVTLTDVFVAQGKVLMGVARWEWEQRQATIGDFVEALDARQNLRHSNVRNFRIGKVDLHRMGRFQSARLELPAQWFAVARIDSARNAHCVEVPPGSTITCRGVDDKQAARDRAAALAGETRQGRLLDH